MPAQEHLQEFSWIVDVRWTCFSCDKKDYKYDTAHLPHTPYITTYLELHRDLHPSTHIFSVPPHLSCSATPPLRQTAALTVSTASPFAERPVLADSNNSKAHPSALCLKSSGSWVLISRHGLRSGYTLLQISTGVTPCSHCLSRSSSLLYSASVRCWPRTVVLKRFSRLKHARTILEIRLSIPREIQNGP